jgi:hypothetical protein
MEIPYILRVLILSKFSFYVSFLLKLDSCENKQVEFETRTKLE